ncbi:MAG: sialidase family protein, partial [Armatimonadota bacterium]|nr:sialidase family protein [Armatimonadota bacterium]
WTKPTVVVDSPVDDRNPAFGEAPDGALVVGFWRTATYDAEGRWAPALDRPRTTWSTRSTDGGKSWSDPTPIDVADIGWGSPYGRILTLPDGEMLMAVYGGPLLAPGVARPAREDHSYLYRSTDHGLSWKRVAEIAPGPVQFNETALLRLPSGEILAAMRSRAGEVWVARSADKGQTWSTPKQVTPAKVHPADLLLLPDGRVLMVVGNRLGPLGVSAMVAGPDAAFDWQRRFPLVEDAVSTDCGYPSSVLLKDGRVLALYYATGVKEHPEWGVHCGAVTFRVP